MATLTLSNMEQKVLFEHEVVGQISDGRWENSNPREHWKPWCSCDVVVGKTVGRDFHVDKYNYNLLDSELLSIIGDRMVTYVRIARHFGEHAVSDLRYLFDDDGQMGTMPTYEGKYYDRLRARLADYDLKEVQRKVEGDSYNRRQLRRDLRDMKMAFRYMTC